MGKQVRGLIRHSISKDSISPTSFTCTAQKQDGTSIWVRIMLSSTMDNGDNVYYVIISDVSIEMNLVQNQIWQNERYRMLAEITNSVTFDYAPQQDMLTYHITSHNDKNKEVLVDNFSDKMHIYASVDPEDRASIQDIFAMMVEKPMNTVMELRLKITDDYRWHRVYAVSLANAYGDIFRIVGRLDDIQAEKENAVASMSAINRDTQYRRLITPNTFVALMFDMVTKSRLPSPIDVQPDWLSDHMSLVGLFKYICGNSHEEDLTLIHNLQIESQRDVDEMYTKSIEFRLKYHNHSDMRWVYLTISIMKDEYTNHNHMYLILDDIHDRKLKELAIWAQANIDALTGLPNQVSFMHNLRNALVTLKNMASKSINFALVMVDIDNFSNINETFGVKTGNDILQQSGQTIRMTLGANDICCRYGVDSFVLFMSDVSGESDAKEKLSNLSAKLKHSFDDSLQISVSIGCELNDVDHYKDENPFTKVTKALYYAKLIGGNQCVIYTSEIDSMYKKMKAHQTSQVLNKSKMVFVRTFGHFDVFVDGQAVLFSHSKAKELLALLIDRNGGFVSAGEAIACLWEDEPVDAVMQARYRKTAMRMKNVLDENGIADIVETIKGKRRVVPLKFECDYYKYMSSNPDSMHLYTGSYLIDYSWAENTISTLDAKRSYYSM